MTAPLGWSDPQSNPLGDIRQARTDAESDFIYMYDPTYALLENRVARREYVATNDEGRALIKAGLYWPDPKDTVEIEDTIIAFCRSRLDEEVESMDKFQDMFGLPRVEDGDHGDRFSRWLLSSGRVVISDAKAYRTTLVNLAMEWTKHEDFNDEWLALA